MVFQNYPAETNSISKLTNSLRDRKDTGSRARLEHPRRHCNVRSTLKLGLISTSTLGAMSKVKKTAPPAKQGWPTNWREQIKADLAAQVRAGGTLYGVRRDGVYIARTRRGDRVIGESPIPIA